MALGYHRPVSSPRRMRALRGLAIAVLIATGACAPAPPPIALLDHDLAPLRARFNAEAGHTRIVMLVAPTCDVCLRGAAAVQSTLLAREPDARLRPFVIWVPKLRGKSSDIGDAAQVVPDARVQHFWDGGSLLMNAYQQVLGLPEDAWDVYLVYGPDARWDGDLPPAPRFWMHQLGTKERPRVRGLYLDPAIFAREALATLNSSPPVASTTPAPSATR